MSRRTVGIADDDRARVPFAVVGLLLLVGSATLTVTVQPERPFARPSVDVAMERGEAETVTAVRRGVRAAAGAAAREPVLTPADTPAGRVLNDSRPFRDALRVRVYLQVRQRLRGLAVDAGGVRVRASLPPTPDAAALRAAKRRVNLTAVGSNRTTLRARISGLELTAHRGNRTVGRVNRTRSVVVRTPVLALHESVRTFQGRVNAGLGRPGLGRRLTGYSYLLAWTRGYAQYGGAPVQNVLGPGHLEVATNLALLQEQRTAFGRSDAGGRAALARGAVDVLASELGATAVRSRGLSPGVLAETAAVADLDRRMPRPFGGASRPEPSDGTVVEVNETADLALARLLAEGNLSATLDAAYTVRVRRRTAVRDTEGTAPDLPDPPGGGKWDRGGCERDRTVEGSRVQDDETPRLHPDAGWHVLRAHAVTVTESVTRTCRWTDADGETERTTSAGTLRHEVTVGVVGRHHRPTVAPVRRFERLHEPTTAGPVSGSDTNLADVAGRAEAALLGTAGGPTAVAERTVAGESSAGPTTVTGERPVGLRRSVLQDLATLQRRVRNVSTTVERGRAGTLAANPAARLADRVDRRRAVLLAAPSRYASASERAHVAARRAYLDAVTRRLRARAVDHRERREDLDGLLGRLNAGSVDLLDRALENRTTAAATRTGTTGTGVNVTAVDGAPTYLTTAAVGRDTVASLPAGARVRPLAVRNVNVFANPAADVTDQLFDRLDEGDTVRFRTAASALRAAEVAGRPSHAAPDVAANLSRKRDRLEEAVAADLAFVRRRGLREPLAAAGVGASPTERTRLVRRGLARWNTTGARALAVSNGSAAASVAAVAAPTNRTRRTLLTARLRAGVAAARDRTETRVPRSLARKTTGLVRTVIDDRVGSYVDGRIAAGLNRTATRVADRVGKPLNRVPAGLPVLPTGTPWWTTVNVWYVEVAGGYDRFAVRARRGGLGQAGSSVVYVRDGDRVGVDYDDDGTPERLGRADRVTFRVRTGVVVAVPPGPQGVGDRNGDLDERSAGWDGWGGTDRVPWASG